MLQHRPFQKAPPPRPGSRRFLHLARGLLRLAESAATKPEWALSGQAAGTAKELLLDQLEKIVPVN
jgi:hypothetical protein